MKIDSLIIGAGLSGVTLAERLANEKGHDVLIVEKRNHIGGNVYDFYNDDHILIHKYGPHIFHTSDEEVWNYLSRFTDWINFKHKVLASVDGKLLPMPINLNTINGYFGLELKNEEDVVAFLETKRDKSIKEIKNSRDVIVSKYGKELYDAFVRNYTKKQWDMFPEELDKEVLERLPVRYDDNPYYFNDKYQGVPAFGYTKMIEKMIGSSRIKTLLNTDYKDVIDEISFVNLFVSSPIDEFFNYELGRLKYRCVDFSFKTFDKKSYQKNSVINYPNEYNYTRVTEMKKLTFQESKKTTICQEFPNWDGEPSYPVPNESEKKLFLRYLKMAKKLNNVHFIGRLGMYKYLNMDLAVKSSLDLFKKL